MKQGRGACRRGTGHHAGKLEAEILGARRLYVTLPCAVAGTHAFFAPLCFAQSRHFHYTWIFVAMLIFALHTPLPHVFAQLKHRESQRGRRNAFDLPLVFDAGGQPNEKRLCFFGNGTTVLGALTDPCGFARRGGVHLLGSPKGCYFFYTARRFLCEWGQLFPHCGFYGGSQLCL